VHIELYMKNMFDCTEASKAA